MNSPLGDGGAEGGKDRLASGRPASWWGSEVQGQEGRDVNNSTGYVCF